MDPLPFNGIYKNKKVLITGNTGFKGGWLTVWLSTLEADIYGYSLKPPTVPSLFQILNLERFIAQEEADVRDFERLTAAIKRIQPAIIFHLAAQSLVRESYAKPLETIATNTFGSVNLMEAVRQAGIPVAVVMITSDKCYDNKEWIHGYREVDPLGGYDPYSASKGAAEIFISSWRNSFFNISDISKHRVRIASARAGNVIGGGDWANDRIVPDCIRDLKRSGVVGIRNPDATRPWQHVLEPLHGYLQLGSRLLSEEGDAARFCQAFNFGPLANSNRTVRELVEKIIRYWGNGTWKSTTPEVARHEASLLNLSIDKAFHNLNWSPRWNFDTTVRQTVDWYRKLDEAPDDMLEFSIQQIHSYENDELQAAGIRMQTEMLH